MEKSLQKKFRFIMMSIWNSYQGDLSIPSIALLDFIFQTVSIIDFISPIIKRSLWLFKRLRSEATPWNQHLAKFSGHNLLEVEI